MGSQLSVLKHERDEFFDPFFFYFRRPTRLLSDDLTIAPQCVGYSLAKASWFDRGGKAALLQRGAEVTELARFQNLVDGKGERADREVVLFLCLGGESDEASPWI
jgi:hypothetical protein